jgi:hypothetical protein
MKREQKRIIESWVVVIRRAIELGDGDAARHLVIGFMQRLRELGLLL